MLNSLFFKRFQRLEYRFACQSKEELIALMHEHFFKISGDPFLGVQGDEQAKIKGRFVFYNEVDQIYIYFSNQISEIFTGWKPFYPHFKGRVEEVESGYVLKGRIGYSPIYGSIMVIGLIAFMALTLLSAPVFFIILNVIVVVHMLIKVRTSRHLASELLTKLNFVTEQQRNDRS